MDQHYHVLGGLAGLYIPDTNDVYRTKEEATAGLQWHHEDWADQIGCDTAAAETDREPQHIRSLDPELWPDDALDSFEVIRSATQINYLYQITECYEAECLENLED